MSEQLKTLTGYPSIDRPWLKYYSEEARTATVPDCSMYDLLIASGKEHPNAVALDYYGTKITFAKFFEWIDKCAAFFRAEGIRGEHVSILAPNFPETFMAIYALNKLGAVANLIDPRNNVDRIEKYIKDAESTRVVMLDIVFPKVKALFAKLSIRQVYVIAAETFLPAPIRILKKLSSPNTNLKEMYSDAKYVNLVEKLRKQETLAAKEYPSVSSDAPAVIINTSGTTGSPKGVILTNHNLNAVAYDYKYSGMEYAIGDKFLGIMPCFFAYGIGVGLHMPMILGFKSIVIPSVKTEEFGKLIMKHRPQHFAGVPLHYQYLIDEPKAQRADLSFIKTPAVGGDFMNPALKQKANDFLSAHGCRSKIKIGYGCTENTGMAASQFHVGESMEQNEYKTVGIPALFTGVAIQAEDGSLLKIGERGEILLSGAGVMQGYLKNSEETAKVIETINGTRFLHTGDVGSVDADGCVYVLGRIKRIVVRPDGHNVFPAYIETAVQKHPAVEACVCVGARSKEYTNGQIPVAFLQLAPGNTASETTIIEEIKELSLRELPERDVALAYFVIDQIPMTPNSKVDYLALEKLAEEKISVVK